MSMATIKRYSKIPKKLMSHLHFEGENGNSNIPRFSVDEIPDLEEQEISDYVWFPVDSLYLRSSRLRQAGAPQKKSTPDNPGGVVDDAEPTVSIHTITETYRQYPTFNGEPILFFYEQIPELGKKVLMVYEGRHRAISANMADREFVLGRHIGKDYSSVISQHSPKNKAYYKKPVYPLETLVDMYKDNPSV